MHGAWQSAETLWKFLFFFPSVVPLPHQGLPLDPPPQVGHLFQVALCPLGENMAVTHLASVVCGLM